MGLSAKTGLDYMRKVEIEIEKEREGERDGERWRDEKRERETRGNCVKVYICVRKLYQLPLTLVFNKLSLAAGRWRYKVTKKHQKNTL
jgi:hypothetical protein